MFQFLTNIYTLLIVVGEDYQTRLNPLFPSIIPPKINSELILTSNNSHE